MDTVKIANSTYDIQEKLLDIASKYMEIDNISTLKTGLFGYMTEAMAHIAKDGVYHRDMLYNEYFINTAKLPKSIYNEAKIYNKNIENAKPSSMKIYFSMKKEDLIRYSKRTVTMSDGKIISLTGGEIGFVIKKNDPFYVSDFTYMLEYDILVTLKPLTNDYSIIAQIYTEEGHENLIDIDTPYIKTWIDSVGNDKYVFFILDIWQMSRNVYTYNVYSNEIFDTLFYDITYTDQLTSFKVNYTPNGENTIVLPKYFDSNNIPTDSYYCYYGYPDDNVLEVFFSGLPNTFRPLYNSQIDIEVFTTKGSLGNFSYYGDILFTFTDPEFSEIQVLVDSITKSSEGGKDRPTLKEIKMKIIEERLVRDNLITENDLNMFLNNTVATQIINGSKIKFIKKRDDIVKRIYSGYLLLKNKNNVIIPTNTVNLFVNFEEVERFNYSIPAGSIIIYDNASKRYRFLTTEEYPEDYIDRNNILMYSTPFMMNIKMEPFPRISYYQNTVNKSVPLSYSYINPEVDYEFIIPKVEIYRNSFLDNSYELKLYFNANMNTEDVVNNIKLRGILKKDEEKIGYFDFRLVDLQNFEYSAILTTDDTFEDNKLCITSTLHSMDGTGTILDKVYVDEGLSLEIGVLYNDAETTYKMSGFDNMPDLNLYTTAVTFKNDITIDLFREMSAIMSSDLNINENGVFFIKSIPVVNTTYFNNQENYKELFNILTAYETVVTDNLSKLQNSFGIDLKFYNTYGICQYSSIDTVNLKLGFAIKMSSDYTSEFDRELKKTIVDLIESSNNENGGLVSISNIIKTIENKYTDIVYTEFKHINGVNQQKIVYLYPDFKGMTSEQLINYVPEFINVGMTTFNSNGTSFNPQIEIEYI